MDIFPNFHYMEINEDGSNKNMQRLLRVCYSKGVSHHHLCFGRNPEAGRGLQKLCPGHVENFGSLLSADCCHRAATDELTVRGHICFVLLLLRCKQGDKSWLDQILTIWSWLLQELFGFLGRFLEAVVWFSSSLADMGCWFPAIVAVGCKSELYLYTCPAHCLFGCLGSQLIEIILINHFCTCFIPLNQIWVIFQLIEPRIPIIFWAVCLQVIFRISLWSLKKTYFGLFVWNSKMNKLRSKSFYK